VDKLFNLMIRKRRNELHMSQEELAFLSGVSQNTISLLEKGNCRTTAIGERTILQIAEALECCPLTLLKCNCEYCLTKV